MPAKLSTSNPMLMKGRHFFKSLSLAALCMACLPGQSLAAAKWADCIRAPSPGGITSAYKVELKTNSDKVSVIRNTVVDQNLLHPSLETESAEVQIIANASWFPSEVIIGPFDDHPTVYYTESGGTIVNAGGRFSSWLKVSRQTLKWRQGSTRKGNRPQGDEDYQSFVGACTIISNPVKTLF